ncbi:MULTISPECIES: hypothetical protein [unclassified Symbiopectobacterium]|uniref:hypothetical protein n=1 Tax=unclassified Symbiopectobacterium TaxID=2794573 RepID=UPI002225BB5F|nr:MULTISPECIES: hypothetical protein [unclassified Symbiopectobacterium]MCW2476625.1 hypothetical protein [Candidatus Symbiopectobacterium sp. NZEC151]MCW2481980.1 hypothetical protein [Candidatus Symbiopectobacterium sp. NZEC135]
MNVYFLEWNANYEKLMIKNLESHGVTEIKNIMKHFTRNNIRLKKANVNNWLFVKIHIFLKLRKVKKDDLIICNGYSFLGFLDIIKALPCKKALVIRDTIIHLERGMKENKKWLPSDGDITQEIDSHFDKVYSFDPSDCKKYDFIYLKQFLPFTSQDIDTILKTSIKSKLSEKSCFFIGEYRPDREKSLQDLFPYFKHLNYTPDFYLFDKHNKSTNYPFFCKNQSLDYKENIQRVIASDVVIEINHPGQDGLTLRTIEALAFNKKIITNNIKVMQYDFYTDDRFFILGYNDIDSLHSFLERPLAPVDIELIKEYTADGMLNRLVSDIYHHNSPTQSNILN